MNIADAAGELQSFFDARGWPACVIGALAAARWGKPRATQHVDFSLLVNQGSESAATDEILARFEPRMPEARAFALEHRVLLIPASNGVPIDVVYAAFPFEAELIARATRFELATGAWVVTASLEDVIVLKAFAGRPQDWVDVEAIVQRQGDRIDGSQVELRLGALLELEGPRDALARLRDMREVSGP
jgi:hypothetical protein